MADEFVKVVGIKDLKTMLDQLSKDIRVRTIRSALRAAAKPIVQAAKSNAPVLKKSHPYRLPGLIRDTMKATPSRKYNGKSGILGLIVKPKAARGVTKHAKSPLDPYYYKFQEYGFTATGRQKIAGGTRLRNVFRKALISSGKARKIDGKEFIGRAFTSFGSTAIKIFQDHIIKRIELANRRK